MLKYQDVFVPGGFPRHTYNPREELRLEHRLIEAKENLCKLVTVTGQTKSGKTVLCKHIFPSEDSVWIDGGTVSSEEDFWQVIIEQMDLFQVSTVQDKSGTSNEISAKGSAEGGILFAKASGEIGGKHGSAHESSAGNTQNLSSRVAALTGLRRSRIAVVIDDFHYIPREMQGSIVRALKPLIFDGLPVIVIAIPHRRYDALKVEKEMTGRISPIPIQSWSDNELIYIPETGFNLLGFRLIAHMKERLASEAIGSPHLMQEFCRGICKVRGIEWQSTITELHVTATELEAVYRDVAETIGRPIFEKLARGPRQRTDRLPRELKDGRTVDIYELVLHALAYLKPGLISLEYEELRSAIRDVSRSQIPQVHEVARVLKHMATIAASDQSSTPVIDFEEEEKKLHVTDPFFAFYLRWGRLAE